MKHLYCAGKIGNATKDKLSDCFWPLWKKVASFTSERHFSPYSFFFYMQQKKMCHCSVFVKFFVLFIIRIDAYANFKLIHMRCKQSFIANKVTENIKSDFDVGGGRGGGWSGRGGTEMVSLPGCKLMSTFQVSKETPNYENLQRRNSPSAPTLTDNTGKPAPFLLSK